MIIQTITLRIPADVPAVLVRRFAEEIGCEIAPDPRGGLCLRRPVHTNAARIKVPHHAGQYRGAASPEVP